MRQIKFRGTSVATGKIIVGNYYDAGTQHLISGTVVAPDTIAQLVGYDSNGREVYEGDILLDDVEQEHIAEIYDRPQKISRLTLKEATS